MKCGGGGGTFKGSVLPPLPLPPAKSILVVGMDLGGDDSLLRTYVHMKERRTLIFSIGNLHQVMGTSNAVSERMTVDVKLIGARSQRQLDWLIRPCREISHLIVALTISATIQFDCSWPTLSNPKQSSTNRSKTFE